MDLLGEALLSSSSGWADWLCPIPFSVPLTGCCSLCCCWPKSISCSTFWLATLHYLYILLKMLSPPFTSVSVLRWGGNFRKCLVWVCARWRRWIWRSLSSRPILCWSFSANRWFHKGRFRCLPAGRFRTEPDRRYFKSEKQKIIEKLFYEKKSPINSRNTLQKNFFRVPRSIRYWYISN